MNKYYVYVINLDKEILKIKKFKAKNPDYIEGKPCVYVGQSVHEPRVRFNQHLNGYKANRYAKKFGNFLRKKNLEVLLRLGILPQWNTKVFFLIV